MEALGINSGLEHVITA